MAQLSRDEGIILAATKWWLNTNGRNIVKFQLFTDTLCMPFDIFHETIEQVLGRPIQSIEFASSQIENLRREFLEQQNGQTFGN